MCAQPVNINEALDGDLLQGLIYRWHRLTPLSPRPATLSDALLVRRGMTREDLNGDFLDDPLHPACASFAADIMAMAPGRILLSSDYDVDGLLSATIMASALRVLGWTVDITIPNRFIEGYGVNKAIVAREAHACDAIMALDCGASELDWLSDLSKKCPVFLIDHHRRVGNAVGLRELNPQLCLDLIPERREDIHCTATLAAMVAWHIRDAATSADIKSRMEDILPDLLFFGGLGAVADVISMRSVAARAMTRRFLNHGINEVRNRGLRYYMETRGITPPYMTSADIGFKLAPPLNAAGRLDDAAAVLALFDDGTPDDAIVAIAAKLDRLNTERRRAQDAIVLDAMGTYKGESALVACGDEWNIGVVGPAAGQLATTLNVPVFLGGFSHASGMYCFSGRSAGGIDVHTLMTQVLVGLPVQMGGHKAALGFRVRRDDMARVLPVIRERLGSFTPRADDVRSFDAVLGSVSLHAWNEVRSLEPYGQGHPEPVVCVPQVSLSLRRSRRNPAMASGVATTLRGLSFPALAFHNPKLASISRFTGDLMGRMVCDRRGEEHIVKLIIEDMIPAA